MKKYYLSFSATFLLVFTSCSSTTSLNHFEKDPKSANAIQYTKKADLIYNKDINSMIFATYLNNIKDEFKSNELNSFLIGTHLVNKDNHDFIKNNYSITLNNKKATNIKKINQKSDLVSIIPLRNSWANYYLLQFENDKSQDMNILFTHPTFGKTQINFQK